VGRLRLAAYTLAFFLLLTAAVTVYYWIDFFTAGAVHVLEEEWYLKFEAAFQAADMWMAACCTLAAAALIKRKDYSLLFMLLAASALIFLALMDITFNLENSLYQLVSESSEMQFELVINIYTLTLGVVLILFSWRNRGKLLRGEL